MLGWGLCSGLAAEGCSWVWLLYVTHHPMLKHCKKTTVFFPTSKLTTTILWVNTGFCFFFLTSCDVTPGSTIIAQFPSTTLSVSTFSLNLSPFENRHDIKICLYSMSALLTTNFFVLTTRILLQTDKRACFSVLPRIEIIEWFHVHCQNGIKFMQWFNFKLY